MVDQSLRFTSNMKINDIDARHYWEFILDFDMICNNVVYTHELTDLFTSVIEVQTVAVYLMSTQFERS